VNRFGFRVYLNRFIMVHRDEREIGKEGVKLLRFYLSFPELQEVRGVPDVGEPTIPGFLVRQR
jgi:hypothetical protein